MIKQWIYLRDFAISEEAVVCEPFYNCLSFLQLKSTKPNGSRSCPDKRFISPGRKSVEVDAISQCTCGKPFENYTWKFGFAAVIYPFICVSRVDSIVQGIH